MAKKKKKSKANKKSGVKKGSHSMVFLILGAILAVLFHPFTLLLSVGMLPTVVVATLALKTQKKSRIVTIGAMNLTGCMFYLLNLWTGGGDLELSLGILSDLVSIVVMYAAAGVGYLVDWAITGIVASMLYSRGKLRRKYIEKRQEELVRRWGRGVTGEVELDEDGFPVEV